MENVGTVKFISSDEELNQGFSWAKAQALSFAHDEGEDLIGKWYEAALPEDRDGAFCIRDVCHQANGAHALGLAGHTKNMLLKFAQSIAESRDYCCFWEMERHYRPAPTDYTSDEDFWYNLPANFDLLQTCLRMYKLTGDRDYIENGDFLRFYRLTVNEFIERWDKDGDGIPEGSGTIRGIPGYEEGECKGAGQMLDLVCSEAVALLSYAEICEMRGEWAIPYKKWGESLLWEIDRRWDEERGSYFFAKNRDGSFKHISYPAVECVPYFGTAVDERKLDITLEKLHQRGISGIAVEVGSHLSEIFYKYGRDEYGEHWLRHFTSPSLPRREYPEVSYACVGAYVFGMMGVKYHPDTKTITAEPHLPHGVENVTLSGLPVFGRYATVTVNGGDTVITYSDNP